MSTRRVEAADIGRSAGAGSSGFGAAAVHRCFWTPWGEGLVAVDHGQLARVELPPIFWPTRATGAIAGHRADLVLLAWWAEQLEAYFRGERLAWSAEEIDLDARAVTAFTRSVYERLLSVLPGATVSYGVLAGMAGFPRAARAVGTAMASNDIPIVIPCHRVIRSDGTLGLYGSDSTWKERLLAHERQHIMGAGGRT